MIAKWFIYLSLLATVSLIESAAQATPITASLNGYDLVKVGDAGNLAQSGATGTGSGNQNGYGTGTTDFWIGKYQVTIGQYTEFLNAVAKTNDRGLCNESMNTDRRIRGITQSGESGSFVYTVAGPDGSNPAGATSPASASSLGLTIGNVPVILPGIRSCPSKEVERWCERTRIAACVPHEIKVWQADPLLCKLTQDMFDVGYGSDDCKVYRYWEEDPVAKIEGTDGIFLVVEGEDKIMVVVSDYGDGAAAVKVTLDTKRLGLPAGYKAVNWEDPGDTATASGAAMELMKFKKHDFRAMLIEKE